MSSKTDVQCVPSAQDVYNDYVAILDGVHCDDSHLKWKLSYLSTRVEFKSWEKHMIQGFSWCDEYEYMDEPTCVFLALRRVDAVVARWWDEEKCEKNIIDATWYDLDTFLRNIF